MPSPRDYPVESVSAGVDWISATLGIEQIDSRVWEGDALWCLGEVSKQGYEMKGRKMLGYDGYSCGNCFVGSNDTHLYAQFSGEKAHQAYLYLDHPQVHVSRLDLQVTVKLSVMDYNEGKRCYGAARRYNATLPKFRQRTVDVWLGSGGADTIYIGAPSSELRGRIYNKEAQSEDIRYTRSWRYEVVYRNEHSTRMYHGLARKGAEASDILVSSVVAFFRERGVTIRGLGNHKGAFLEPVRTLPTDIERKLKWVEKQVVPTVRKLAEMGYAEQVMEMLAEAISAARNSTL